MESDPLTELKKLLIERMVQPVNDTNSDPIADVERHKQWAADYCVANGLDVSRVDSILEEIASDKGRWFAT